MILKKIKQRKQCRDFLKKFTSISLSKNATNNELNRFYDNLFPIIEQYTKIYDGLTKNDLKISKKHLNVLITNYIETITNINKIYLELLETKELNYNLKMNIAKYAKQNIKISNKLINIFDTLNKLMSTEKEI